MAPSGIGDDGGSTAGADGVEVDFFSSSVGVTSESFASLVEHQEVPAFDVRPYFVEICPVMS